MRSERGERACQTHLGSASERAKGRGAVWAKSGCLAQHYYDMLLARLGMGEGERANTSAGSRAGWPPHVRFCVRTSAGALISHHRGPQTAPFRGRLSLPEDAPERSRPLRGLADFSSSSFRKPHVLEGVISQRVIKGEQTNKQTDRQTDRDVDFGGTLARLPTHPLTKHPLALPWEHRLYGNNI